MRLQIAGLLCCLILGFTAEPLVINSELLTAGTCTRAVTILLSVCVEIISHDLVEMLSS